MLLTLSFACLQEEKRLEEETVAAEEKRAVEARRREERAAKAKQKKMEETADRRKRRENEKVAAAMKEVSVEMTHTTNHQIFFGINIEPFCDMFNAEGGFRKAQTERERKIDSKEGGEFIF